jgi:hypothetical protein
LISEGQNTKYSQMSSVKRYSFHSTTEQGSSFNVIIATPEAVHRVAFVCLFISTLLSLSAYAQPPSRSDASQIVFSNVVGHCIPHGVVVSHLWHPQNLRAWGRYSDSNHRQSISSSMVFNARSLRMRVECRQTRRVYL